MIRPIAVLRILGALAVAAILPACGIGGNGTLAPTVAPQVPQSVVAKAGNHRVALSWVGSSPATSYTVKRSTTPGGPYTPLPLGTVSTTAFVDTGLVNHVTYYYVVSASNNFGESPDSPEVAQAGALRAAMVCAGSNSASALLQDGTVWSWGLNLSGGLGNGLTTDSSVPVQAVGLPTITQIAIGGRTGFALDLDGRIWSWGYNNDGNLGRGTGTRPDPTPGLVDTSTGLPLCRAISAGWFHALALGRDGTLWSWGFNAGGRLGYPGGSSNRPHQVVPPPGLSVVTAIATGNNNSYALSQDGTVWAWGENNGGQLGVPALGFSASVVPVQVLNLTGVTAIAAGGDYGLALRNDGSVWSWGQNDIGQLGNGIGNGVTANALLSVPLAAAPVVVSLGGTTPLSGVVDIDAQSATNLALRADGSVWSWGAGVALGDPMVPTANYRSFAFPVPGLSNQASVAAGHGAAYSVSESGVVSAWGANTGGECAFGTALRQNTAVQLPQLTSVTQIAAGGSTDPLSTPPGGLLSPGEGHALSISSSGLAWSWGNNNHQALGMGPAGAALLSTPHPQQVLLTAPSTPLAGVTAIAAGGTHSILVSGGGVWCVGENASGQLGRGNFTASNVVVQTLVSPGVPLANITAVSAGQAHGVALRSDGTVWTWGLNAAGQLGDGSTATSPFARQVRINAGAFLTNVIAISAGFSHGVALLNDNTVWAWGQNQYAQVGNGSTAGPVVYATPVQVVGGAPLTGIVEIAAGRFHTLARTSTGTVMAWGDNTMAQLGIDPAIVQIFPTPHQTGATTPNLPYHSSPGRHSSPIEPPRVEPGARPVVDAFGTPLGGVVALSAGAYHSVALRDDLNDATRLSIWTWGDGSAGALGNADATIESPALNAFFPYTSLIAPFSPVPVPVQQTVPTGLGLLRGMASISAGAHYTLARSPDGTVWGWGSNVQSQLGSETLFVLPVPVPIDP